jgi:TonB family protein
MSAGQRHAGATSGWPPGWWRSRTVVVLLLLSGYLGLLYGVAHTGARRSEATGPPMLTPVISEVGVRRGDALEGKPPPAAVVEAESTPPARHWIFAPIDIWPSTPGRAATLSEFTPVSEARADPRDPEPALQNQQPAKKPGRRTSTLRLVRWLRPEYPPDWAAAGVSGAVVLDLLIDPSGKPAVISVAQSSGAAQLDAAALTAAKWWRFAPPRGKSGPVEVWGRVEVRFHQP